MIPIEAISALVRNTCLSKEEIFWLLTEWEPNVTDEQLEEFWSERKVIQ